MFNRRRKNSLILVRVGKIANSFSRHSVEKTLFEAALLHESNGRISEAAEHCKAISLYLKGLYSQKFLTLANELQEN